jgi:hypothetical protein
MNRKGIAVLALCVILLIPAIAMADGVVGSIQGFRCVTQGKVCAVGAEDPMAAVENVFVLFVKVGDFYFLPPVPKAVLTRFINVMVKVEGKVSVFEKGHQSIDASNMYKKDKDGNWKKVWSSNPNDPIYNQITMGTPLEGS